MLKVKLDDMTFCYTPKMLLFFSILADEFYTPNDLFYVRSHLPTPDIDPAAYELEVNNV